MHYPEPETVEYVESVRPEVLLERREYELRQLRQSRRRNQLFIVLLLVLLLLWRFGPALPSGLFARSDSAPEAAAPPAAVAPPSDETVDLDGLDGLKGLLPLLSKLEELEKLKDLPK